MAGAKKNTVADNTAKIVGDIKMIKVNKQLLCGCCGQYFRTWEGYKDQDQDKGYGICKRCQLDNEAYERKQAQRLIDSVKKCLSPDNLEKYEQFVFEEQLGFAIEMLEKGEIKYCIKPSNSIRIS